MHRSLIAGAAAAAALVFAVPAAAEPFNGFFVGAQGGWQGDRYSGDVTVVTPPGGETLPGVSLFQLSENASGFAGGIFIGADGRVSEQFVIGGEVGVNWGGGSIDLNPFGPRSEFETRRTIDVTARAGVLATPQTLIYARGGYSNARYRLLIGNTGQAENRDGWTLGAGVEQAFSQNVTGRIEYRYSDYGRDRAVDPVGTVSAKATRNQVMAGVAFHF